MNLEKEIIEYQKKEKRFQTIVAQRVQLELQKQELENAISELKTYQGDHVYRQAGGIFFKIPKEKALQEAEERMILIERRLKTLKEEENILKETLERMAKKLQQQLGRSDLGS